MASSLLTSPPTFCTTTSQPIRLIGRRFSCAFVRERAHQSTPMAMATQLSPTSTPSVGRRSGNYLPCIWDDDFLQSLTNPFAGEMYTDKSQKLMAIVRTMLNEANEPVDQRLELIDSLQRLGLAYHFKAEIKNTLQYFYHDMSNDAENYTLHTTALKFRLLRDHGYYVPSNIFCCFKDKNGGFKENISSDLKGLVSLYEASFYGTEGESIMEEAMDASTKYLKGAEKNLDDPNLAMQVEHALEVPLRWKQERLEARWCIEAFERRGDTNPLLLELAKLDYNFVQSMYQDEVKDVSRWWRKSNLGVGLSFSRNRLVASYLWGVGIAVNPQFEDCRRMLGKTVSLIGVMDDMYDIYGTLDELQLFTDAIERWDVTAMKQLPEYMKPAYLALFNLVNEMAYDVLMKQGCDVVLHLKNAWLGLLRAYLLEARWYHTAYAPTLEEYLNNAMVSVTAPMIAVSCYVLVTKPIVQEELEFLESLPDILQLTSLIIRLEDDLGTYSDELKRGDVPKSIQCYMRETGASEEAAREHMRQLKMKAWKKINKYQFEDIPLPNTCVEFMLDFVRMSHFFYRHGDGHSDQDYTKDLASSLLFDPIPLNKD